MARGKKVTGKAGVVSVNFKGVESRRTPPEGDYPARVVEAKKGKSGAGNEQIEFVCEISRGEYKGSKLYLYCPLTENSLWKLHGFLTALGEDVPEDDYDIDLSSLLEKEFVAIVHHETYNGKKQAKMNDFDSLENYSGDLVEDEKGGKKKKKDKKGKKDKEAGKDKKSDSKKDDAKSDKKKDDKKKPKDDAKGDKKKGGKDKTDKKEKVKKYDADDIRAMDAKALKGLIKKHELDVDLTDYKTLKKQAAAVVDALESEDLIED
jgi:hypothetical protein